MSHPAEIGRFVIIRPIGSGGMGTVYEALDSDIERRVAIKLLRRDILLAHPELAERLYNEARAANRIEHPGVVLVSERGTLADGTTYLVMELLEGPTLTERMEQLGARLPQQMAVEIARQVADTLLAGHRKGIIHRDLKPDNIKLVSDRATASGERVKLLDFGIAKLALSRRQGALTEVNSSMGTPGYMAPEQIRDAGSATDRCDVYALGVMLFQMLTGRRPYVADSSADVMVKVLTLDAPLISELDPDIPEPLVTLVQRTLVREPAAARPSMAEVLRVLDGVQVRRSSSHATISPREHPVPPTLLPSPEAHDRPDVPSSSTLSKASGQKASSDARRWTRWASVLSLSLLAAVALLGVIKVLRHDRSVGSPDVGNERRDSIVQAPVDLSVSPLGDPELPDLSTALVEDLQQPALELSPPREPSPRARRPQVPSWQCIQADHGNLPQLVRQRIAQIFVKAGIRVLPGESIVLIRQGSHLVLFEPPARLSGFQDTLHRMLRDDIDMDTLPGGLYQVRLRCSER